jgi:6-pyruvoyltetrahydropterin/6-carboxytetrahydropterin synthase
MTTLTRRYRFSASHRLDSSALSARESERIFGKCNHPFGHGHDYVLEVTVAGEPDGVSGLILPISELDELVEEKILRLFRYRYINLDVGQFASVIPTTENVTQAVADLLKQNWREHIGERAARIERVRIEETGRNSCEICLS